VDLGSRANDVGSNGDVGSLAVASLDVADARC
jgi:hypothetical protein